jgi:hypothetical protein
VRLTFHLGIIATNVAVLGLAIGLAIWWVARRAVRTLAMSGREGRLGLQNGLQAPVARSARSQLRLALNSHDMAESKGAADRLSDCDMQAIAVLLGPGRPNG